ncbi:hypothetical protein QE152_g31053 [Popillia japonica]|uniref:Uncharacterized protein n=1 Tax=Popillia japonica TaxID=7064 RepID=A0AAW1JCL6_POPJA
MAVRRNVQDLEAVEEDRQHRKEAGDVADHEVETAGRTKKTVKILKIGLPHIQRYQETTTKKKKALILKEINENPKNQITRKRRSLQRNQIIWIYLILLSLQKINVTKILVFLLL